MIRIPFVDSHTAGEPTRVVTGGLPDLPGATLAEQRAAFARDFDRWRRAINTEPRGHDVLVSALLLPPGASDCVSGVIFFNNAGMLGMCGHGTIGVVTTLAFLGRLGPGRHRLDTPVGVVEAELHPDGRVSVANVPARVHRHAVEVSVPGHGLLHGDVAWGGNWFFISEDHGQAVGPERVGELTAFAGRVRAALEAAGVAGEGGAVIDHIELVVPGEDGADARSFVLCPGGAYDRSPCGTGTSAKLACLAAEGRLAPGETWLQESVIGSRFEASYQLRGGEVHPTITGRAFVTARGELLIDDADPFAWGL